MAQNSGGQPPVDSGNSFTSESPQDNNDDNLYVVTENGEQCFMWRSNQLTYIAQDRQEIPSILASKFGHLATKLDLSYNSLTSFKFINSFTSLSELVLDNNCLDDDQLDFKQNLRLKTLSLNKNKLNNLSKLISSIKINFPNLEYLSLIGNPLCPGSGPLRHSIIGPPSGDNLDTTRLLLDGGGSIGELIITQPNGFHPTAPTVCESDHQKYRQFIIFHLPNLRFLDSSPIRGHERDEALRRCFWMKSTNLIGGARLSARVGQEPNGAAAHSSDQLHYRPQLTGPNSRRWTRVDDLEEEEIDLSGGDQLQAGPGQQQFQLTIMSSNGRQAASGQPHSSDQPKGVFSRLVYKYTGRNSEGNRFIRNQDL